MFVEVINMIPHSLSSESNMDSEPNITVNPANPRHMAASAFTPDPMGSGSGPIYVSTDGGQTWALNVVLPGGNGLAFDWRLIAGHEWPLPWMLSGGLTAALLPEAVRLSGASAVDVSSGVERRPGDKDPAKIREFLAAARSI